MLRAFCGGFAKREPEAVMGVMAPGPELEVVTSEEAILRGEGELRGFLDRYAAGPTTYSWEWERAEARSVGDVGWVLAEGVETAEMAGSRQRHPYRMTLICKRREGHWLVTHVHGSSPLGS